MKLLVAVLLCLALPAHAATGIMEWNDGSPKSLRVFEEPCMNDTVIAQIIKKGGAQQLAEFKRSLLRWDNKDYASCYIEFDEHVLSIDEAGDLLMPAIPVGKFRDTSI